MAEKRRDKEIWLIASFLVALCLLAVLFSPSLQVWSPAPTVTPPPTYSPTKTLTIKVEGDGTTIPEPGDHSYPIGTEVSVRSVPVMDVCRFDHWELDGEFYSTDARVKVPLTEDRTLVCVFVKYGPLPTPTPTPYTPTVLEPEPISIWQIILDKWESFLRWLSWPWF